jgi:4-amino-4-deoxy-L-arabinose transferase-like glycosyltransferase
MLLTLSEQRRELSGAEAAIAEQPGARAQFPRLASWSFFLTLLAAYLAVHLGVRLGAEQTLLYDESEQFVLVQTFAWGYNAQPPLMTWCFLALAQLTGETLLTLTLLRLFFLGAIYVFIYASARLVLRDPRRALAVVGALLLLPIIAYESVCDRVHTTKLTALCMATLYVTLRLLAGGRARWYAALGVCCGLGFLCKYNFALFALALAVATWSMPQYRRRLRSIHLLTTGLIGLAIVTPHLWWLAHHHEELFELLRAKGMVGQGGGAFARLRGLLMIPRNLFTILGPLLPLVAVLLPQLWRPRTSKAGEPANALHRWLTRFLLLALLLLAGIVLVTGMAHLRPYWMSPFLVIAPLLLFARLDATPLAPRQWRAFGGLVGVAVILVVGARLHKGAVHATTDEMYGELLARLRDDGFTGGLVFTKTHREAGNLRLLMPQARAMCTLYPAFILPEARDGKPTLLLWDATRSEQVPKAWRKMYRATARPRPPVRLVAARDGSHPPRISRLGYVILAP